MFERARTTIAGVLLTLLLFASTTVVAAKEIRVFDELDGRLRVPAGDTVPVGAVLMLHGFNDDRDGVGDLQRRLAEALAARGVASLRFDFSGEGERAGFVVTSTHASRRAEAARAHALLRQRWPGVPIGVLGWSLGGLTAMTLGAAHPDWFASMVIWSGARAMNRSGDPAYSAAVRTAMAEGRAVYRDWTDITLTREHLSSYVGVDASDGLERYPGSFLAIRGDRDHLPRLDPDWLARLPTDDKAFLLLGGADHIFNVLDATSVHGDRVIEATAAWFARTLERDAR